MKRAGYGIGELARHTGVREANIRYYEDIGILPRADRRQSGHRNYGVSDLERVMFVKSCRELGFSLEQVRALVYFAGGSGGTCGDARELAAAQLILVQQKMAELSSLEVNLRQHVAECDTTCLGGPAPDCSILKSLSKRQFHAPRPRHPSER